MGLYVEVSGSGTASAPPDVVRLDVGVRCDGDDVSAALADARDLRAVPLELGESSVSAAVAVRWEWT